MTIRLLGSPSEFAALSQGLNGPKGLLSISARLRSYPFTKPAEARASDQAGRRGKTALVQVWAGGLRAGSAMSVSMPEGGESLPNPGLTPWLPANGS